MTKFVTGLKKVRFRCSLSEFAKGAEKASLTGIVVQKCDLAGSMLVVRPLKFAL